MAKKRERERQSLRKDPWTHQERRKKAGKVGLIGGREEESGTQRTPLTLFNPLHWPSPDPAIPKAE